MAKFQRKNGSTSNIIRVKIYDSTVTTGAGKTGLTSASSGLVISTIADNEATATAYTSAGSTIESITTLGTFAAPTATKVRFKEVDATNHPGVYEIQIADARFAVSSAKALLGTISGVTGAAQCDFEIQLSATDVDDGVRGGMTALPNAAANANGGLPILSSSGTTLAYTISTLTTYTGNTVQTGDAYARIGSAGAGLTAIGDTRIANLDAAVSSRMATYTQPTGFLAATFPTGTIANTTNITAGTITTVGTVITLTNLPAITANWLTGTGVDATAVTKIQLGLATSVQIPANFTAALFASAGVFSVGALANAPTGGSAPTAADIRAEIDSNSTQLAAIVAAVDSVPAAVRVELTTELGRIDAAITTRATPAEVNDEVLDVLGIQTLIDGKTIVESHQIIAAIAGGVVSGAGTGTETFLGLDGLTDRVVVTVDEDGNRTEVTYP